MKQALSETESAFEPDIHAIAGLIADTQKTSGEIPWFKDDKTDPWDHVESAMGLTIGGYFEQARHAFEWLAKNQLHDGSWHSSYRNGLPEDKTRDANLSSYIAVGLFHYFMVTQDLAFINTMWETMYAGIEFALGLQKKEGQICWAISPDGNVDNMALLTGSSSIYMSIKCDVAIAHKTGRSIPEWQTAMVKLKKAINLKPHLFNVTKARFSMDWFYPILCGAVTEKRAKHRISTYWKRFIVDGQGVKCVSDQPWITLAETAELVISLSAIGNYQLAETVFNWIYDKRFEDGSYLCGFTYPDMVVWPEEKITWTNAVVLMAWDALYNFTPAGQIFSHEFWKHMI